MNWLIPAIILTVFALAVLILLFWQISNVLSALYGAPAVSSPQHEFLKQLADRKKTLLDLGCGNGSLCIKASPYFNQVYGIEFSPFYYLLAKVRTSRYPNITIMYGNFFTENWPEVDYIYCYLLPKLLGKLQSKLEQSQAAILSYGFAIPTWKPNRILIMDNKKLFIY